MKGVIVAGGYGTRFLPITKSVPKEMLPLKDKPIIEYIIEELSSAGVKDILVVISEHKQIIKDYFSECKHLKDFLIEVGKESYLSKIEYQQKLANISFVNQERMGGFQDAVRYARDFVGDDDFILCTGDNLFDNPGGKTCVEQMLDNYKVNKQPLLVTIDVPEEDLPKYGVVKYEKAGSNKIKEIVEKPKSDFPSNDIAAGRYLLPAKIFKYIDENKKFIGHELNFSECLNLLAKNDGYYTLRLQGIMLDTGNVKGYIEAFNYYINK